MRLINFLCSLMVVIVAIVGGRWYIATPQPILFNEQMAFAQDTVLFELERYGQDPMTPEEEVKHWRPMAQSGNIAAALHVSQLLFALGDKHRDPKHYRDAVALLRVLADRGVPAAQNALGYATLKGLGDLNPNIMDAYVWFDLAADRGHKGADKNLEQLTAKMTNAQILDGENRSNTWVLNHTR